MRDVIRLDVPVALVVLGFFLMTAFQTQQLIRERNALANLRAEQDAGLVQAEKVRGQFQMLAGETAKLANSGNATAKAVLDQLQAEGITVNSVSGPSR